MDDETYGWMALVILAVMAAVNPLMFNLSDLFDIKVIHNTINSQYLEHRYTKVPSYIKEYSLETFLFF